jgi:hypothetical protein
MFPALDPAEVDRLRRYGEVRSFSLPRQIARGSLSQRGWCCTGRAFGADGLMRWRLASINDLPIFTADACSSRRWTGGRMILQASPNSTCNPRRRMPELATNHRFKLSATGWGWHVWALKAGAVVRAPLAPK